jgi:hypothetical protein
MLGDDDPEMVARGLINLLSLPSTHAHNLHLRTNTTEEQDMAHACTSDHNKRKSLMVPFLDHTQKFFVSSDRVLTGNLRKFKAQVQGATTAV